MRREYPATSAAKIAASFRSIGWAGLGMGRDGLGYVQVIRGGEWDQALSQLGPGQLPSSSANRCPHKEQSPSYGGGCYLAVWALTVVRCAVRLCCSRSRAQAWLAKRRSQGLCRAHRHLPVFSVRK